MHAKKNALYPFQFFISNSKVNLALLCFRTFFRYYFISIQFSYFSAISILGEQREHLVKGPHGSLVAEPIEVKFHIDSDDLKPNDEGIVINYESHPYENHHHHHGDEITE